jgi:hypothetical protein
MGVLIAAQVRKLPYSLVEVLFSWAPAYATPSYSGNLFLTTIPPRKRQMERVAA